jgi:hypothetical protein
MTTTQCVPTLPVLGLSLHPREPIEWAFEAVTIAEARLLDALRDWFGEGPIYRELAAGFLTSGVSFPSAKAKQQYLDLAEALRTHCITPIPACSRYS